MVVWFVLRSSVGAVADRSGVERRREEFGSCYRNGGVDCSGTTVRHEIERALEGEFVAICPRGKSILTKFSNSEKTQCKPEIRKSNS